MTNNWKGKTFTQVTTVVNKNKNDGNSGKFASQPLKHYRREMTTGETTCNPHTSLKINELNTPNGAITTASLYDKGLNVFADGDAIKNESLTCVNRCSYEQTNALNRVRKTNSKDRPRYDANNQPTQFMGNQQYLKARNKSVTMQTHTCCIDSLNTQRNIKSIVSINDTARNVDDSYNRQNILQTPQNLTINNINLSKDLGDIKTAYISNELKNNFLIYSLPIIITNETPLEFLVIFPDGYYNVHQLNAVFEKYMFENGHYYTENNELKYFYKINYNIETNKIEIIISSINFIQNKLNMFVEENPNIYITEQFAELIGFDVNEPNSASVFTRSIGFDKNNTYVYNNITQTYHSFNHNLDGAGPQYFVIETTSFYQNTNIRNYFNNVKKYINNK